MSEKTEYTIMDMENQDWEAAVKGFEDILEDPLQWVINRLEEAISPKEGPRVVPLKSDIDRATRILKLVNKEFKLTTR